MAEKKVPVERWIPFPAKDASEYLDGEVPDDDEALAAMTPEARAEWDAQVAERDRRVAELQRQWVAGGGKPEYGPGATEPILTPPSLPGGDD